jgi:hypothetical protein
MTPVHAGRGSLRMGTRRTLLQQRPHAPTDPTMRATDTTEATTEESRVTWTSYDDIEGSYELPDWLLYNPPVESEPEYDQYVHYRCRSCHKMDIAPLHSYQYHKLECSKCNRVPELDVSKPLNAKVHSRHPPTWRVSKLMVLREVALLHRPSHRPRPNPEVELPEPSVSQLV